MCLFMNLIPSNHITLIGHHGWRYGWKIADLAKVQWPMTFKFDLSPLLLINENIYALHFCPSYQIALDIPSWRTGGKLNI